MKSLSIIVTVWDRPENLELLLKSLCKQSQRPEKVIIIDYMSENDNTFKQFQALGSCRDYFNTLYIDHIHKPKMFRLMECYKKAIDYVDSEFVGVFDVDMIFHTNYLERVMGIMAQYENIALSTATYILPGPDVINVGSKAGRTLEDMASKDDEGNMLLAVGGRANTRYFCTADDIKPTHFGTSWDGNVFIRTKHAVDYDIFDPNIVGWGNARDSMARPLLMNGVSLVNVKDIPAFHVAHEKTGNYFDGFQDKLKYMQEKWSDIVLPESNELIKIGG